MENIIETVEITKRYGNMHAVDKLSLHMRKGEIYGFVILLFVIAQFMAMLGLGPYFPWAIPGVYTAPPGTEGMHLFVSSYFILALTCLLSIAGTLSVWRFAEQH